MAEQSDLLKSLRVALAAFDDDAFAALANKGLVKRARKDLETKPPTLEGERDGRIALKVEDCTVLVPAFPKDSTCTCPAGKICRHVLAALMFLKESALATGTTPAQASCLAEILTLDDSRLESWAGKPLVRRAISAVARGLTAEFEDGSPAVLRLPAMNIVCRWMPGAGPEGLICSCHSRDVCDHRVCAVVAVQVLRGARQVAAEVKILEEASGTPRTREEVLDSLGAVLSELLTLGLGRVSSSTEQRLRTLAMSAHGVDLPRLERMVRALADETRLLMARDAQASTPNLMNAASRIEALREALKKPKPEHVGQHRSAYGQVGELEVVGLGARQWQTRSGFVGLTVYFWDRNARGFATWSESRSLSMGPFDPQRRYAEPGPWTGCEAAAIASRSTIRLSGAWRNAQGRLSGRSSTRAMIRGDTKAVDLPPTILKWSELLDPVYRLFGAGLGERRERDEIVLIRPHKWERAQFGSIAQELVRPVADVDGRSLPLVLPFTAENQKAVEFLEQVSPERIQAVLGLLRLNAGRLSVEPISLIEADRIMNLNLDSGTHVAQVKAVSAPAEEEPEIDEEEFSQFSGSPVGRALQRLETGLERIAERGLMAHPGADDLSPAARRLADLGLTAPAAAATRVTDALLRSRKSMEPDHHPAAEAVLRAYFVTRLTGDLEALAVATEGLR